METITLNSRGAAVEDVQRRLVAAGHLSESAADGFYGEETAAAVRDFCRAADLPETDEVTDKVWAALVDATFELGDRTLYLRMPYFHGCDVRDLQRALGALGFSCGPTDGIFGVHTELALRKFQTNLGLPTDGIAGAYTYSAIRNLQHSWKGKEAYRGARHLGFARVADVLERNAVCLFGTEDFTRSVASRMSNLALATNPYSKIVSADSLLVQPDEDMLLMHITVAADEKQPAPAKSRQPQTPVVSYDDEESLATRLSAALAAVRSAAPQGVPQRVVVELPGTVWFNAGEARSAQHYAITLLDALCEALP